LFPRRDFLSSLFYFSLPDLGTDAGAFSYLFLRSSKLGSVLVKDVEAVKIYSFSFLLFVFRDPEPRLIFLVTSFLSLQGSYSEPVPGQYPNDRRPVKTSRSISYGTFRDPFLVTKYLFYLRYESRYALPCFLSGFPFEILKALLREVMVQFLSSFSCARRRVAGSQLVFCVWLFPSVFFSGCRFPGGS